MAVTTDGLVHEYVGKRNAGASYSAGATSWTDLIGGTNTTGTVTTGSGGGWVGAGTVGDPYALHSEQATPTYVAFSNGATWQQSTFSIELWAMLGGTNASNQTLFDHKNNGVSGFSIYIPGTATIPSCELYSGDWHFPDFPDTAMTTTFHHLVFTYNGTSYVGYVDNVASSPDTYAYTANTTNTIILGGNADTSFGIHGSFATLRWYNKALSAGEVDANYDSGVTAASDDGVFRGLTVTRLLNG